MRSIAVIASALLTTVHVSLATAQQVQFPTLGSGAPPLVPVNPSLTPGPVVQSPPPATLGGTIQPFDPYALPGNVAPSTSPFAPQPTWPNTPLAAPPLTPSFGAIPGAPPAFAPPVPGAPYGQPTPPPIVGTPVAPLAAPANTPPLGLTEQPVSGPPYQRLFQDTGLRATYLYGREAEQLGLTEVEASTTAFFANFLGIPNGLRVTPGFVFHWTNGPSFPIASDVPARLYSGYLDFGLMPQFGPRFVAELNGRVGIYSDFEQSSKDSIRFLGTALGIYRVSDHSALKLGVVYLDRLEIKLLPAFGLFWEPNPQTRWDIFFPAPKLSNYWTTVGNKQIWWYIGGEYGGGNWSIQREGDPLQGENERIDINDIRIFGGLEWWNLNRYSAFLEIGYVFDRKIVYYEVPDDSIKVDDTIMVRGGVTW